MDEFTIQKIVELASAQQERDNGRLCVFMLEVGDFANSDRRHFNINIYRGKQLSDVAYYVITNVNSFGHMLNIEHPAVYPPPIDDEIIDNTAENNMYGVSSLLAVFILFNLMYMDSELIYNFKQKYSNYIISPFGFVLNEDFKDPTEYDPEFKQECIYLIDKCLDEGVIDSEYLVDFCNYDKENPLFRVVLKYVEGEIVPQRF